VRAVVQRTTGVLVVLLVMLVAPAAITAIARQPPSAAAQEGFVPIDQLPPDEALPAAPLLITAYAAAWVIVLLYLWSIWRRLGRVERELAEVGRRLAPGARR
jgi:CcmD family protein